MKLYLAFVITRQLGVSCFHSGIMYIWSMREETLCAQVNLLFGDAVR